MNPIDDPDAYVLDVAGTIAPGVVTIVECDIEGNWDDKEADGQDGASTAYKGKKLGTFKSRHDLAVDPVIGLDEIGAWPGFVALLESTVAGESPVALDVYHPDLATQGITSATYRKVSALRHDGRGGASAEVMWKAYAPPKPKPAKGTAGSKSGTKNDGRTYGDDKVDEATDELDALLKEGDP